MSFNQAPVGSVLQITHVEAPLKFKQKLESLGLVPNQRVKVLSDSTSGKIAVIKNVRLAISKDLGACVEVTRA